MGIKYVVPVYVTREANGYVDIAIEAQSPEEAKQKVQDLIDESDESVWVAIFNRLDDEGADDDAQAEDAEEMAEHGVPDLDLTAQEEAAG